MSFLDVSLVSTNLPAWVTQRFRFRALGGGQTVVSFTYAVGDSVAQVNAVEDTVVVH